MFDLDFYYQVFDCIKATCQNTHLGVASFILGYRDIRQPRHDIINLVADNKAAFNKYKANGIIDYCNDYVDYFY